MGVLWGVGRCLKAIVGLLTICCLGREYGVLWGVGRCLKAIVDLVTSCYLGRKYGGYLVGVVRGCVGLLIQLLTVGVWVV